MGRRKKNNSLNKLIITFIIIIVLGILGCYNIEIQIFPKEESVISNDLPIIDVSNSFSLEDIPEYSDKPYIVLNNNIPNFTKDDYTTKAFETYSELDKLGRCGTAYANICMEIMPSNDETRGAIGSVKPSGWKTVRYNGIVDGNYLYNRCHLIGWQLAGENSNKKNLITGTRYMNVEGMLPFENLVDDYFEKKENENNHVLYRVTPIFEGNNLVANGVQMEAYSVEDKGKGICFNVYVYNVQPRNYN